MLRTGRIIALLLALVPVSKLAAARNSAQCPVIKADAALKAVMAPRYGPYDNRTDTWTADLFDPFPKQLVSATMRVCATRTFPKMNPPERLVAICGSGSLAHGAGGLAEFYLLRPKADGTLEIDSSLTGSGNGSNADPGQIFIRQFGPALYGFVEEGPEGSFQGTAVAVQTLYLPWNNKILKVLDQYRLWDLTDTLECDDNKLGCDTMKFDMSIKQLRRSAVWPITIHMHGTLDAKRVDRTLRLNFDPTSGTYPVPDALSDWDR